MNFNVKETPSDGKWYLYLSNDRAASDTAIRTNDGTLFDVKLIEAWGAETVETLVAEGVDVGSARQAAKVALLSAKTKRIAVLRRTYTPAQLACLYPWVGSEA